VTAGDDTGTGPAATDPFDVDASLARIGHRGGRRADLATLRSIVAAHAGAIAFENLDPFLGRPVRLDPVSLQAKLVRGGRGGYCYEQNLLLTHALRTLGYRTTGWAARVLWGRPAGGPLPARTHMLVGVDLDEGPHVVDVGFGGLTLTGVLRLEAGIEQPTPHEPFRLVADDGEFLMEARVAGAWRTLYRFGTAEHLPPDYEVTSWYLSHHPESHFVTGLMLARPAPDRRYALAGRQLTVHHLGGGSERRSLASPRELIGVLEHDFLLDVSGLAGLEDGLRRLF
jgi:N-hydroxyarylamine O-acetyltransferase